MNNYVDHENIWMIVNFDITNIFKNKIFSRHLPPQG